MDNTINDKAMELMDFRKNKNTMQEIDKNLENKPNRFFRSDAGRIVPNKEFEDAKSVQEGRILPNKAFDQSSDKRDVGEGVRTVPVRRILPNKAFDQEYMTEWIREVKFLAAKGIRYAYVKKTPDYGISQFKYKKTPALFEALVEFYTQVEKEKANIVPPDQVEEMLKGTGITIRRGRNGEIKFVKTEIEEQDDTE